MFNYLVVVVVMVDIKGNEQTVFECAGNMVNYLI